MGVGKANQWKCALSLVVIGAFLAAPPSAWGEPDLRERLQQRLEARDEAVELAAGEYAFKAPAPLQTLYESRDWRPIWFDEQGVPSALKAQMLAAVQRAADHGLDPRHYHLDALVGLTEAWSHDADAGRSADIELLASDALLSLGHHLLHGKVDPETIDPGWALKREVPDLFDALAASEFEGPVDLVAVLDGLAPQNAAYLALREQLALQREASIDGNWRIIPHGPLLRPGESDPRVPDIRGRLRWLGDLEHDAAGAPEFYDEALEEGVRAFQRRHGLDVDGIVGPQTLTELNTMPGARIGQLRANLERWRWLPRDFGDEYILVNIAGYSMKVRAAGETVMEQRVIVGTPFRRTPVFTGRMTYLVIHPYWEVPHRLAVRDQLPRIQADPEYLERQGFKVYQGWGSDETRIDPAGVDWDALSARNFPYRLRQSPGPANALGRVKFMFPNRHNVYLHDTPTRGQFATEARAFSSGCIRIEDPDALTKWLLNERSNIMPPERIRELFDRGVETTVSLDRPLPVHLLYWTAWVDEQGRVQYRHDIYSRDLPLIAALNPGPNSQGN